MVKLVILQINKFHPNIGISNTTILHMPWYRVRNIPQENLQGGIWVILTETQRNPPAKTMDQRAKGGIRLGTRNNRQRRYKFLCPPKLILPNSKHLTPFLFFLDLDLTTKSSFYLLFFQFKHRVLYIVQRVQKYFHVPIRAYN